MHPNETTLNDYVDGSLGAAERSDVDQHLAGCAACRQLVEDLRDILRAAGEPELREPPVARVAAPRARDRWSWSSARTTGLGSARPSAGAG